MKKFLIRFLYFIFIIFLIFFQISFLDSIKLFGVIPNIGVIFVAGIGAISGKKIGLISGIVYGILMDCAIHDLTGIYILLYAITGYLAGNFQNQISNEKKTPFILVTSVCTLGFELAYSLVYLWLKGLSFNLLYVLKVITCEEIYNLFLAFVFYRTINFFGNIFNRSKSNDFLYKL